MAKCLVGASGSGKVIVYGLSADVLIPGKTVTVKSGAKTIAEETSNLEVLASVGWIREGFVASQLWDGTKYNWATVNSGQTLLFSGVPKFFVVANNSGTFRTICGKAAPASIPTAISADDLTNSIVMATYSQYSYGHAIVFGVK